MFRTTCSNQTFFTGFACSDFSVKLYMMNFKKGSQITGEKLAFENRKTKSLYLILPLNHDPYVDTNVKLKTTATQPVNAGRAGRRAADDF